MGTSPGAVVPLHAASAPHLDALRFHLGDDEFVVFDLQLVSPAQPGGLTPAEQEVAALTLRGFSNAAIALRRGTATRTVANQVASIFRKSGVASRSEFVARCARKI